MKRDTDMHIRLPKEIKDEAKRLAVYDNRTLAGFVVESIKERNAKVSAELKRVV